MPIATNETGAESDVVRGYGADMRALTVIPLHNPMPEPAAPALPGAPVRW